MQLCLAAEWWQDRRPEIVPEILDLVKEQGLTEALCNQMSKLDFLPKAKELTESLCGPQGPFGKAEVLKTSEGLPKAL